MEDHIHIALIALQDRLAALEGAQQAHIEQETSILQLTRRVEGIDTTATQWLDTVWMRLLNLERIARLAHAERQAYRAWQEDADAPWAAVKAARAALDGALAQLTERMATR